MKNLYSNPLRIYFFLACLAFLGLWSGSTLPVSLFPNVTQPSVDVGFDFKGFTPDEFRKKYGEAMESGLKSLKRKSMRVEKVDATYSSTQVRYEVLFNWSADPDDVLKEVKTFVDSASASMPTEVRDTRWTWSSSRRNKGFFLATVSSDQRSPGSVFQLVDPQLRPRAAAFEDGTVRVINPDKQQVSLQLKPQKMLSYGLFPEDVVNAIETSLTEVSGGSLRVSQAEYLLMIPARVRTVAELESLEIATPKKTSVRLGEVAQVSLVKSDSSIFKTSGVKSVLIIANLKDGGNIKRLSENLKDELWNISKSLPPDIKFEVLVDPSLFIRDSIQNVVREVSIGAGLAVIILFLFIGSLRNVVTAAIEIPLSLVLALILMKIFDMNINLISLGGLALSSGMNVDASVVVLENIFRKFEGVPVAQLSARERLERVVDAVKEVFGPLLASTIASLVVFIPIVFTSDLTNAILGDLAKAVVFSHVFSAFVALLLVPTVRLQLMKRAKHGSDEHKPPVDFVLVPAERLYERSLRVFSSTRAGIWGAASAVCLALAASSFFILPKLPTEIIGKPDSELVGVWGESEKFKKTSEAEALLNDIEQRVAREMPQACQFTYVEIHSPRGGFFLCRLPERGVMKKTLARMEEIFKSTPEQSYEVFQWSVAELPVPNPPATRFEFTGGDAEQKALLTAELLGALRGRFPKMNFNPIGATKAEKTVSMLPIDDVWRNIGAAGATFSPVSLLKALRQYSQGEELKDIKSGNDTIRMAMSSPQFDFADIEELRAFPVALGDKILPLRALFSFETQRSIVGSLYVNGEQLVAVDGSVPEDQKKRSRSIAAEVEAFVKDWKKQKGSTEPVQIKFAEADAEVRSAVRQLAIAAGWSVFLIFLTMFIQFGTVIETLLVLVAVPLALLGVLISLYVFDSTLSVNSVLGVILLNGISVANSILLVDFAKRRFAEGCSAFESVIEAAKRRLRPILITSLTTILGMMPIALGMGEGGRVLQPLGIAVSGGMWISMLLTIFFVPALHGLYLRRLESRR